MARKQPSNQPESGSSTTLTGTIKTLIVDRGFGFVRTSDGHEYFFHRDQAPDFDRLQRGTAVTFVPTQGTKGPRAESVTRA